MLVDDGEGSFFGGEGFAAVAGAVAVADEERIFTADGRGGSVTRSALCGADGEGEGGGAIGVAVGCGMGAVEDVAGMGDGAIDGMEIFADVARDGDEEFAVLECGSEAREKFGLE